MPPIHLPGPPTHDDPLAHLALAALCHYVEGRLASFLAPNADVPRLLAQSVERADAAAGQSIAHDDGVRDDGQVLLHDDGVRGDGQVLLHDDGVRGDRQALLHDDGVRGDRQALLHDDGVRGDNESKTHDSNSSDPVFHPAALDYLRLVSFNLTVTQLIGLIRAEIIRRMWFTYPQHLSPPLIGRLVTRFGFPRARAMTARTFTVSLPALGRLLAAYPRALPSTASPADRLARLLQALSRLPDYSAPCAPPYPTSVPYRRTTS